LHWHGYCVYYIYINLYIIHKEIKMLTNAQEKTLASSGNATQRAYTVEEVFD